MSCAPESDMAFARAMDYAIDKEDFWQLSSSVPPHDSGLLAGDGSDDHHDHHYQHLHQQHASAAGGGPAAMPAPSDFFDQFVVMEMDGADDHMSSSYSPPGSLFGERQRELDLDQHHRMVQLEYPDDHGGHQLHQAHGPGLDHALSPPTSASSLAAEANCLTSAGSSHVGEDQRSVDMMSVATSVASAVGSAGSTCPSSTAEAQPQHQQQHQHPPRQGQTCPRQEQQRAGGQSADSTKHVVLGHLNPETLEQRRRLLSGRAGQHHPLGGSISDSELLRLEGLSVDSPSGLTRLPKKSPSPPSSIQHPPTAPALLNPRTSQQQHLQQQQQQHQQQHQHQQQQQQQQQQQSNIVGRGAPSTTDDIDLCNLGKTSSSNTARSNFKAGARKFESIYSTIRRAVGGHSRGHVGVQQQPQPQHSKTTPIPQISTASHMDSAKSAPRRLPSEGPYTYNHLSPPPTAMYPSHSHASAASEADFVTGTMDDPFFDPTGSFLGSNHNPLHSQMHHENAGILGPAAHINNKNASFNANISSTPLATPTLKQEPIPDEVASYFPPNTEAWALGGNNFVTSSELPQSIFMPTAVEGWGFDPSANSGPNMHFSGTNNSLGRNDEGEAPPTAPRNHHNLTIHIPPNQSSSSLHLDSHHTPGSDDFGGSGMLRMPQPRTPNTAPLLESQLYQAQAGLAMNEHMYSFSGDGTPQNASLHSFRGPYTEHGGQHPGSRRPKPRAPSSGARYQQQNQLSLSPRKVRQPSSSSSSPSPTPLGGHGQVPGTNNGGRRSRSASRRQPSVSLGGAGVPGLPHRKSTTDLMSGGMPSGDMQQTHAIRKRRSGSNWRGGPGQSRRPSTSATAVAVATAAAVAKATAAAEGMDLPGSGISFTEPSGGAPIGFVNYTPDDRTALMTGVAPSGSSKTKMRREKEAQEKQRKLSEAVVKAVAAAGVNVQTLKDQGLVI